jgi:ATP-dependent Lon protease
MYIFTSDIGEARLEIIEVVRALHHQAEKPDVDVRNQQVKEITDAYIRSTGVRPEEKTLERLGDYILVEYMQDANQKPTKTPSRNFI